MLRSKAGTNANTATLTLGNEVFLCDLAGALYWPAENCLIVADLHLEKGSSYARRGQMLPPYDTKATLASLSACFDTWKPARVIALGDSFHDAMASQRLASADRSTILTLMRGREWIWLTGNHDPERPHGLGGEWAAELAIGPVSLRHEPACEAAGLEIAGHLHPQARIVRQGNAVRRRCFVTDGRRLIMPAFGAYTGGLNIRDSAFFGLFAEISLWAQVLGRDRLYRIPGAQLV
jgi:uncharacterized protein